MVPDVHTQVHARDVIVDAVTVRPLAGRNTSVAIERTNGGSIIKRFDSTESCSRERRLVADLLTQPECPLHGYVPAIDHSAPAGDDAVAICLIRSAHSLWALDVGRGGLDAPTASALGCIVAMLHRLAPPDWVDPADTIDLRRLWLPDLDQFEALSLANRQLLRLLQGSGTFQEPLEALGQRVAMKTFIHGDLRLANVLLAVDGTDGDPQIWLIDWEAAGRGDPYRDLGAIVADLLTRWATSMSYRSGDPAGMVAGAQIPLAAVRSFTRHMLAAYDTGRGIATDRELVVGYTGVSLVTNALTMGDHTSTLMGHQVLLLQLAEHCLSTPADVARNLLGL